MSRARNGACTARTSAAARGAPHVSTAERQRVARRHSDNAAVVLALTLPGDVLLYVLLPLHVAAFGVTLPEAGLLLAANRFVRIIGYGWVARSFQRHGARRTCLLATLGAAASTFAYALATGVVGLLVARLVWGLSFAAMNIATQVLATVELDGAARRSGRSRAIVSVGPMLSLIGGAALSEWLGPQAVFVVLGAVALIAFAFARRLPAGTMPAISAGPRVAPPTRLDVWSFVQGLILDGLFVIGLAVLAAEALPQGAALAAASTLALRYLTEILLGPLGGSAAERYGAVRVLVICSMCCAVGLMLIGAGALWSGALLVVVLRGVVQPLPAPVVALTHRGDARIGAIARVATWRDLGAGAGPLVAGALIPICPAWLLYGAAALMLGGAAAAVGRKPR